MPEWIQGYIGKRRYRDMKTRSAKKLATELTARTVIFYGEEEGRQYPPLIKRSEETAKLAKHSKLILIKDAPHDIEHPEYQSAIKAVI
jgi:hypothetical protein